MKVKVIIKDIREMTPGELEQKVASLKEELFNLRFQMATGQLENPMRIHEVKKNYRPHQNNPERMGIKCWSGLISCLEINIKGGLEDCVNYKY